MIHQPVTHLPNTSKNTDYATINSGSYSNGPPSDRPPYSHFQNNQSEQFTNYHGQSLKTQGVSHGSNPNLYHQPQASSSVTVTSRSDLGREALNKRNNQALVTIGICFLNSMDAEAYAEKLAGTGCYQVVAVSHSDFAKTSLVAILADHCLPEMEKSLTPIFRITRDNYQPCSCCRNVSSHSGWSELIQQIETAIQQPSLHVEQPSQSQPEGSLRLRTTHAARRGLPPELDSLTKRELDILQLVGQGMSVRDMAEHLQLADSTVGNHKYRLMKKLGAKTSLELLKIAVRCGLADFD